MVHSDSSFSEDLDDCENDKSYEITENDRANEKYDLEDEFANGSQSNSKVSESHFFAFSVKKEGINLYEFTQYTINFSHPFFSHTYCSWSFFVLYLCL